MDVLDGLRILFGSIFILFVPGFAWSYVFFARKSIGWSGRVAISFGLSIALVPLTIFWLNWLFHVRITVLNALLIVCGLTAMPILYILITKSSWGKNATGGVKSTFGRGRSKKGS